jgi:GNAT superfamily N-acetyltransferase
MTYDYAQVIANYRGTFAESHETIMEVIVLTVDAEEFHIDNVAVEPSHRGEGFGRALLEFAEAEARCTVGCRFVQEDVTSPRYSEGVETKIHGKWRIL